MTQPPSSHVAETVLRLNTEEGGVIEVVKTPGLPDVMIFVAVMINGHRVNPTIALDLTPAEVARLREALG